MYIAAFVRLFCLNDEEWSSRDVAVRSDVAITILDQLQAWKKEEKFFLSPTRYMNIFSLEIRLL